MPGGERASRSAFTLIEMMVVIVIIALLMALLLPALGRVRTSAKEASVIVEIKQLESAIAAFKAKYGREPPSRFSLYLTQTGWNSDPAMRGLVRQIWPQFDFTMGDPTNMGLGKGTAYPLFWWDPVKFPGNAVNMNAGECLLFFLGGVIPNAGINQVPTGFAKNPQYPFAPPTKVTSREGPFFEFSDISRIKDIDGNGVNEWYDSLPGQSKPYLYFSSYEGQGYRIAELSDTNYTSFVTGLHDVYRVYSTSPPPFAPATPNATPSGTQTLPAQKPQTFQIISPGYDGDYGWGGVYNPSLKNAGLVKSDGKPQPSAIPDPAQYDNLTNFAGGRLNP
jgi:general secretion pathway protein G